MTLNTQECFGKATNRFYERKPTGTLLYLALAGSHGYGTATESSDLDIRGVFVGSSKELLGFREKQDSMVLDKDGEDTHFWEIRHFFRMCADANPNVIETLWAKDHVAFDPWLDVRDVRDYFLSRRLGRTYLGYALGNWKRAIKGAYPDEYTVNWKDLMHLIRLIRTGQEVLKTGNFRPRRDEDREYFLAIKSGEVSLKEIEEEFEQAKKDWDGLVARCPLPEQPNVKELDDWLTSNLKHRIAEEVNSE